MPILTRYPKRHDSRPIRAHRKPSQHASAMSANGNDRGCAPRDTWSGRITPSNAVAQDLAESRWKIGPARPHGDRFRKNNCTVDSMTSSPRPAPPALLHAILKSERAPRSLRARPDGKALRSVSSSAAGPQNPAAGDTGIPEPLQGLPDDSIEIARTVAVWNRFFLPESRKRGDTARSGLPPVTAASHLFRITPHGFPSSRREPGGDDLLIFKRHLLQGRSVSKCLQSPKKLAPSETPCIRPIPHREIEFENHENKRLIIMHMATALFVQFRLQLESRPPRTKPPDSQCRRAATIRQRLQPPAADTTWPAIPAPPDSILADNLCDYACWESCWPVERVPGCTR